MRHNSYTLQFTHSKCKIGFFFFSVCIALYTHHLILILKHWKIYLMKDITTYIINVWNLNNLQFRTNKLQFGWLPKITIMNYLACFKNNYKWYMKFILLWINTDQIEWLKTNSFPALVTCSVTSDNNGIKWGNNN